mgnify:FL=1
MGCRTASRCRSDTTATPPTSSFSTLPPTADRRKRTCADQSDTAGFTAIDVAPDGALRGVIVSSPRDRIAPERWDHTREAMLDNADQSDLLAEHES